MNQLKFIIGIVSLFLFPLIGNTQIETSLIGEYEVVEGSSLENIEIYSNKVEGFISSELVEKFFFYDMTGDTYILEKVKTEVTSIDISIAKERKLIGAEVSQISPTLVQLNISHPNGTEQEIKLKRKN